MNPIYEEAGRVLDQCEKGETSKVIKVARAGATTGIIANLIDRGETFFLVAPTLRIAHEITNNAILYSETANGSETEVMKIYSNRECAMIQAQLEEHPMLAHLAYIPHDSCKICETYDDCPVTRFIRVDTDIVVGFGMTYAKFMVMIEAQRDKNGEVVSCLLNSLTQKFYSVDVIIFDEAHQIEEDTIIDSIEIDENILDRLDYLGWNIKNDNYDTLKTNELSSPLAIMTLLIYDNEKLIENLKENGLENNQKLIKDAIINEDSLLNHQYINYYNKLIKKIKKSDKYSKEDIILIQSILNILKKYHIIVQYIQDGNGIHINFGTESHLQDDIRDMLKMCGRGKNKRRIIFTSATFTDLRVYKEVFGDYNIVRMEDVMHTNISMTVFPDIGNRKVMLMDMFKKDIKKVKGKERKIKGVYSWAIHNVKKLLDEFPGTPVITMKRKTAAMLYKALKADGYETTVDYYRSINMIGVDNEGRRAIFVGMPVTPSNTFDIISNTWQESQARRINQEHAAFYQAINRFKDPQGKTESFIHCVGIQRKDIENALKWAEARQVIFNAKDGRLRYDHVETVDSSCDIGFDEDEAYFDMEMFEPINVFTKKKVALVSEKVYKTEILNNSIYYLVYENCKLNIKDLKYLFLSDVTHVYAKQTDDGRYFATYKKLNNRLLNMHLKGQVTLGVYPKSWDGTTKVSCIDVDTHDGDDPIVTEQKLQCLMETLYSFGVPFVLEESSPESYHILTFYKEGTPTSQVYYLLRDIVKFAGYKVQGKGSDVIEIFPRRGKPYNPQAKGRPSIGMQFRLPCGKHQKKGTWSKFIDPITREEIQLDHVYRMNLTHYDFEPDVEPERLPIAPVQFETGHGVVNLSVMDAFRMLSQNGGSYKGDQTGSMWRGDCPFCGRRDKPDPSFTVWQDGAKCYACGVYAHDALAMISKSLDLLLISVHLHQKALN